jgi:branched-chain amino acid transport system permease protein
VVGYAGLLDLGYVAFYAAGAYVAGWFASQQFAGSSTHVRSVHFGSTVVSAVPGIHISGWILLVAAALFAALLGVLIGLPTLRLRGDYLAIVTLGFGEIIPQVVRNGDSIFGQNITNGPNGLTPIDSLGFGQRLHSIFPFLPANFGLETNSDNLYYWTGLALVGFTLFCCIRLRDSRLGRAWVAIREDEIAAAAMGVPLMRTKTYAYAIGAFFGGMAGCFFAIYKGSTFPGDFSLNISIFILCMVILGGMGNVWGVCLGGALLAWLNYQGLASIGNTLNSWLGTSFNIPKYEFLIFGIIIVATMLFRPQGLIPSSRRRAELELGIEGGSLYDASA